jgi:hypothetical protein
MPPLPGIVFVAPTLCLLMADTVEKVENRGAPKKSRECRMMAISAAARLHSIDASVGGGFCASRCGPSQIAARETHERP